MSRSRFDASSRYELDEGGITASRVAPVLDSYRLYTVSSGDTVDNLAHRILGDHNRWWEIADMNPQLLFKGYSSLTPGGTIRVPV